MNRRAILELIRESLVNWAKVSASIYASSKYTHGPRNIELRFRNGVKVNDIREYETALSLIAYYHYSNKLGIFDEHDLYLIRELKSNIIQRLHLQFNQGEIRRGSPGVLDFPKDVILYCLVRKFKPLRVIETGVAQGVSSSVILSSLKANGHGHLFSIDHPNYDPQGYVYNDGTRESTYLPERCQPGWLIPSSLRDQWTLQIGKSLEILPDLKIRPDMFYHDSEHSYVNMMGEFEWAYSHLVRGGLLVSDDITWNRAFDDFAGKHHDMSPVLFNSPLGNLLKS